MAQTPVYSVNAVGYINVDVCPGFSMIANQLVQPTGENTVAKLFAGVPEGTTLYMFDPSTSAYLVNSFEVGEWTLPNMTLSPGQGAFIKNPGTTPFKVTFVGEVPQGNLSTPLVAGFQVVSSQVPQKAALDTVLGFPVVETDVVYLFDCATQNYVVKAYEIGEWTGGTAPEPNVGEAFFVKKAATPAPTPWTRSFSVNN
jgi:hypothetical protein